MKKKEFKKPEIKLVKMEQNISILAASGDDTTPYMIQAPMQMQKRSNITFDR